MRHRPVPEGASQARFQQLVTLFQIAPVPFSVLTVHGIFKEMAIRTHGLNPR
jgi:hypothetical protein